MPLWRGGPNTRTLPTVLLTPSASKAADMAHLCVPQNQALGVCRGFVPDIQICGTHGREDLVNATMISTAEEEEEKHVCLCLARLLACFFFAWTTLSKCNVLPATVRFILMCRAIENPIAQYINRKAVTLKALEMSWWTAFRLLYRGYSYSSGTFLIGDDSRRGCAFVPSEIPIRYCATTVFLIQYETEGVNKLESKTLSTHMHTYTG